MSEWRQVVLGEFCDRVTVGHVGKMANEYVEDGIPYLRSKDVRPFAIDESNLLRISPQFHHKLAKSELRCGDVVVVRTGYPGTAAVIPPQLDGANCSDLVIITPGRDLNAHFLAAIFNSSWGRAAVGGNLVGSAQQHFNVGSAKALRITIPDKPKQDRIADVLCSLNDLIENNRRRIAVLEQMAQALYREWFVDMRFPGHERSVVRDAHDRRLPNGWTVASLGSVCELVRERFNEADHSALPLVDMARMQRATLSVSETGAPSDLSTSRILFREDDVLFGSIRPYLHKVALAPYRGVTNTSVLVLRASTPQHVSLLPVLCSSHRTVAWATQHATGTKMPVIKWDVLRSMPLVVPDSQTLQDFDGLVAPALGFIKLASRWNTELRRARDLLLPRLATGAIDVSALDLATLLKSPAVV